MFFLNAFLYLFAFIAIWFGAGLIVSSVDKFSKHLKFSPFAFSFVILGLLTSAPELAVGLQSIQDKKPEVFVGDLIGGITVIFLFIIPLLAILGNGINLKHEMDNNTLLATFSVIIAPAVLFLDSKATPIEGIALIILYGALLFIVERKHGIFDKTNTNILNAKSYSYGDMIKLLVGIGVVVVASNIIVDKTLFFGNYFNIPAFYISLIVISLGTNLPELSVAISSVFAGNKDIAMGDYMGSAAANTFIFGLCTVLMNGEIVTSGRFFTTFLFILTALFLFYIFFRTKKYISRTDGIILLLIYIIFNVLEYMK